MSGLTKPQKIIVRALQKNSETTLEALAPLAGKSVSSVKRDIDALLRDKVILGHKAVIDRRKIGLDVLAVMMISLSAKALRDLDRLAAQLEAMENVIEFARVAGDFDFFVKIASRNTEHHYEIARQIADLDGVARCMTFIVLKEHLPKDLPID